MGGFVVDVSPCLAQQIRVPIQRQRRQLDELAVGKGFPAAEPDLNALLPAQHRGQ